MTLIELRKQVKELGFKISLKANSFGRSATFTHIETGYSTKGNVFTPEVFEVMKPLFDFKKVNQDSLKDLRANEDILGLT